MNMTIKKKFNSPYVIHHGEISMLVLERILGQSIRIGSDITITVLRFNGKGIKLGITAPQHIKILRSELKEHDATHDHLHDNTHTTGDK